MASLGKSFIRGALSFDFAKEEVARFGARLENAGMGLYKVHWPAGGEKFPVAKTKSLSEAVKIAEGMAKDVAGAKKPNGADDVY